MTEGQSFLLLLAILYLEEASYWLPHGALLARVGGGGGATRAKGWANTRGVLAWLSFFGAGRRSPVAFWPFSVSEEGLSAQVVPSPNPGWPVSSSEKKWAWADVKSVSADGRSIAVNGERLATCISAETARTMGAFLRELRDVETNDRAGIIARAVKEATDAGVAKRRIGEVWQGGKWCRWFSQAVFPLLFFVIPMSYWFLGSGSVVYALIIFLWLVMLAASVAFFKAHRCLTPELSGERWQHLMIALVAAPHAARLPDLLSRNALSGIWPIAIASEGTELGDALRRDLAYPLHAGDHDTVAKNFYEQHLSLFAQKAILPEAKFACPRCLGEFSREGTCPDCPGVNLVVGVGEHPVCG